MMPLTEVSLDHVSEVPRSVVALSWWLTLMLLATMVLRDLVLDLPVADAPTVVVHVWVVLLEVLKHQLDVVADAVG